MARRARGRPAAGRLLPCRLHAARRDRRHRLPQQGGRLRPAVQGGVGDDADHRRRPQASRRPHRHHRRAPHLGLGDDPSSACPHDRAGRRHRARRERWISSRPAFLLPVRVLGKLFRRLFLDPAARAARRRAARLLRIDGAPRRAAGLPASPAPVRKKRWVVYAKAPFAGPEAVLAYLSRYTHRVAISNSRLIAFDEDGVTFRYKDYRRDGADRQQVMTLATDEFIRRFLLHVLPRGFHRIRHYGLLASSARKASLALGARTAERRRATQSRICQRAPDFRPPCPCCGGRMIVIETFERWSQPRAPPPRPRRTGRTAMTRHGICAVFSRGTRPSATNPLVPITPSTPKGSRSSAHRADNHARKRHQAASSHQRHRFPVAVAPSPTSAADRNPHSCHLWPAGSCMRGFRTPVGTRNPSPYRPLGQLWHSPKQTLPTIPLSFPAAASSLRRGHT